MLVIKIIIKVLKEQRRSLLYWCIGLLAMAVVMSALYPSIRSMPSLDKYIQELPEAMKGFIGGELTDYSTPAGYFTAELYGFMVPLLFLIFGIGAGAGAIAGEEEKGTLDFLLANPVPRWSAVAAKFGYIISSMLLLAFVLWLGIAVCSWVIGIDISLLKVAEANLNVLALSMVFAALALLLGCMTGNRGMSLGISGGLAVVAFLLNTLGGLVEGLKDWRFLSPFYQYVEPNTLKNGIDGGHFLVLVGLVIVFFVLSIPAFTRRDLAV
ncbi:MAG: ABC transporter permease subunit [Dehalococcoidales bacterium]|nr:ABC transporter permease subunit [Dehalococcoidales bacterium]